MGNGEDCSEQIDWRLDRVQMEHNVLYDLLERYEFHAEALAGIEEIDEILSEGD